MSFDPMWSTRRLVSRRDEAFRLLGLMGEFTPGTISEAFSKCGKPTCHCSREDDPGHGPRWLWVRYAKGKTRTRTVPLRMIDRVRAAVARYQRFTDLVREISEINAVLTEREFNIPGGARSAGSGQAGQNAVGS